MTASSTIPDKPMCDPGLTTQDEAWALSCIQTSWAWGTEFHVIGHVCSKDDDYSTFFTLMSSNYPCIAITPHRF